LQLWNAVLALKVSRKHNRRIFKRESERLTWYPSYTEISIFFSLNHPIRWVCITGVVVAIDDYYGTRVYTVDDSTGQCIECSVAIPKVVTDTSNCRDNGQGKDEGHAAAMKNANNQQTDPTNAVPTAPPPPDIDVGMVVEVKGSVKLFRNQIQIKIRNVTRILSTSQEVLFWDKTRDFRRDVLSQPWMLKDREVRRCRKLQQVEAADLEEKKGGKKHTKKESEGAGERTASGSGSTHESEGRLRTKDSLVGNSVKVAKAQRAARTESLRARLSDGNKYNALGL
jgi:endo-1,3(4)-beta-glucanase